MQLKQILKIKLIYQNINNSTMLASTKVIDSQNLSTSHQNTNQYRYQKALKQINKLISVNREIKSQSERYKNELIETVERIEELFNMNSSLQLENKNLRNQIRNQKKNYDELEQFCKNLQSSQKEIMNKQQKESLSLVEMEYACNQKIWRMENEYSAQLMAFNHEIQTKNIQIHELEEKFQSIYQVQAQNRKIKEEYYQKIAENQQLTRKVQNLNHQIIELSSKIKSDFNQDLISKLKINQEWINTLNQQNYNLKQKVLQQEYNKERQKCTQTILQNMKTANLIKVKEKTGSSELLLQQFSKQVQKKVKKFQDEKVKLEAKYKKLKQKHTSLQDTKSHLERQLNLMIIKTKGYQRLTAKQQIQIEKMIEDFNSEMSQVVKGKKSANSPSRPMQNSRQKDSLELNQVIQKLQIKIGDYEVIIYEKDNIIRFLQTKIKALQQEQSNLRLTVEELEQDLQNVKNSRILNSKININQNDLAISEHVSKNVIRPAINVKKIQSQNDLELQRVPQKPQQSRQIINSGTNNLKKITQPQVRMNQKSIIKISDNKFMQGQKKIIFSSGQISYVTSQRNYEAFPQNNAQRLVS